MNKDTVIQELIEQGKNTVRKQKLALTKWITDVNYIVEYLESQKHLRSVPIHLGIEYSPKEIRALKEELKLYQEVRESLTPPKEKKPKLVNGMFVIAPCSNELSNIVKGERYEVSGVNSSDEVTSFFVGDNYCLLEGCAHLGGKNWKVEKPVTRQMKRKN